WGCFGQEASELNLRLRGARIQPDCIAPHRLGLFPIPEASCGRAKRRSNPTLKSRSPIVRLDLIGQVRKFFLLEQGIGEDGQEISLVPVALACSARLALCH